MIFVIAFVPACDNLFWPVTGSSLQNRLARRAGTIALKDYGFTQTDFLKERVDEKKREVPRINDGRRCKSERLKVQDICISRREKNPNRTRSEAFTRQFFRLCAFSCSSRQIKILSLEEK